MNWINRKDREPNPKHKILAFCKGCKMTHSIYNDYDEWCLPEHCDGSWCCPGGIIDFDYWMPIPKAPI
jgi:hypothetical protein